MRKFILSVVLSIIFSGPALANINDNKSSADNGTNIQYVTAPISAEQLAAEAKVFGKNVAVLDESPKFQIPLWVKVLAVWIVLCGAGTMLMRGASIVSRNQEDDRHSQNHYN